MNALIEKQRYDAVKYVEDQTKYAYLLANSQDNPSIWERQLGQPFTSLEFERRLKKLNPNLHFEVHPAKPDKKCLYLIDIRGKQFICAYENGYMPEQSVWRTKDEEIWDGTTHIKKADLPDGEFVDGEWMWNSKERPGYTTVKIPYGEAIRGWRTVLLKIIGNFINTPAEVEKIFGTADTAGWAQHTGKSVQNIPF